MYLYNEGLRNAKTAEAAILFLIGAKINGVGWGLSAIGVAAAYGGKSALETAVNKAWKDEKGIGVYYEIHHSVQSYNKVRYVVE